MDFNDQIIKFNKIIKKEIIRIKKYQRENSFLKDEPIFYSDVSNIFVDGEEAVRNLRNLWGFFERLNIKNSNPLFLYALKNEEFYKKGINDSLLDIEYAIELDKLIKDEEDEEVLIDNFIKNLDDDDFVENLYELRKKIKTKYFLYPQIVQSHKFDEEFKEDKKGEVKQRKKAPPWFIGMTNEFYKDISHIDRKLQGRILEAITDLSRKKVEVKGDVIKPLTGQYKGLWRYRLGDYRMIFSPNRHEACIMIIGFASRGGVYDN